MLECQENDKPVLTGMYVAYIDDEYIKNYAKKVLLMYMAEEDKWYYLGSDARFRGHVYVSYGPLPALKLV